MFRWHQLELLLVMLSIRMYKCRKIILNTNISRHKVNVHPGDLQFLQHLMESHRFYLHFNRKPIKTKGHNLNATKNCNLQVTKPFHQARFLYLCPPVRFWTSRVDISRVDISLRDKKWCVNGPKERQNIYF